MIAAVFFCIYTHSLMVYPYSGNASKFVDMIILTRKWVMNDEEGYMEYSELFIKRIRSLCRERGIAINKLAAMSDVKQSTLDNIVRGMTKNPGVRTLHKVANAFNMTLAEFLDFRELNEYSFEEDGEEEITASDLQGGHDHEH